MTNYSNHTKGLALGGYDLIDLLPGDGGLPIGVVVLGDEQQGVDSLPLAGSWHTVGGSVE